MQSFTARMPLLTATSASGLGMPLTVRDSSLTLTQFCTRLKRFLFTRAYETSSQRLRDSLGCRDRCANINFLTYLLTYLLREKTLEFFRN